MTERISSEIIYELAGACEYCGGNVQREATPQGILWFCPVCHVYHSEEFLFGSQTTTTPGKAEVPADD